MSELFLHFVNSGISAGWLILAVLLLRSLLLGKMRGKYGILLWIPIVFRLILPWFPESSFSLLPSAEPIHSEMIYSSFPVIESGFKNIDNIMNPSLANLFSNPSSNAGSYVSWLSIVSVIWIIGFCVMLLYSLICQIKLSITMRERIPVGEGVYICDKTDTAFVMGILNPKILLPTSLNSDNVKYVVLHEQNHISSHDYLWKIIAYILLCIYWFNPLMWIAYYMFCSDLEFACDEKTVKNMNLDDRKAYAKALLECSRSRKLIVIYPLSFGKQSIKIRMKQILKNQKPVLVLSILSVIAFILLVFFFLSDPFHYLKMNTENVDYHVQLPYKEDFEDKTFQYVRNTEPAYKWMIKHANGNRYLECVAYNENETYTGNNISPILLGDRSWTGYNLSFDVKLGKDSYVLFAPYADSNNNPETVLEEGFRDPWTLYLDSEGHLYFQTFLGECYLLYNLSDSANCFNRNEWNHITLYHTEDAIIMTVNGTNIGKVADYSNDYYGRVSFGGTVGVMLDNIEIGD